MTELNVATGAVVRDFHYRFTRPLGIDSDGTNVWVTDSGRDSVTVFPAT